MNKIRKTLNIITNSLQVTKDFKNQKTKGIFQSKNFKTFLQKICFRYGHSFSNLHNADDHNQLGSNLLFDYFELYHFNCDRSDYSGLGCNGTYQRFLV